MNELVGLMNAYRSWDYYDFIEVFFVNRFPSVKTRVTTPDNGLDRSLYWKDDYAREKWMKFQSNPVSYMCSMDSRTLEAFREAITKEINHP
jgi:hypothetical protein